MFMQPLDDATHPFWEFSLRVYRSEGVAEACLALQDERGADVNMVLYCCWVGASGGGALESRLLGRAAEMVAPWQDEVVGALRAARRRLKRGFEGIPKDRTEALRKSVAAIEIEAEHAEQILLAKAFPPPRPTGGAPGQRAADAAANLVAYLRQLAKTPDTGQCGHLRTILAACFPDLGENTTTRLLEEALAGGAGGA
jgi:uncharacterized protein (TIGR02444 family)